MGKRRKTLKEKIRSDIRHIASPNASEPVKVDQYSAPVFSAPAYAFSAKKPTISSVGFTLRNELIKTFAVSLVIAGLQLVLFLLLTHHTVMLPIRSLQY